MPCGGNRNRPHAAYRVETAFIYNRRPVYRIDVTRGILSGEQISELLSRFRDRVLFPEEYGSVRYDGSVLRRFESYRDSVFIRSVLRLFEGTGRDSPLKVCLFDPDGKFSDIACQAAGKNVNMCVLTSSGCAAEYCALADKLLLCEKTALPVFTDARGVGAADIVVDCLGGTVPEGKIVISRKCGRGNSAVVPASALPDGIDCPNGYDSMFFSFALHRFCADDVRPAQAYDYMGNRYGYAQIRSMLYATI